MPLGRMSAELAQARANRSAAVALAVFTPHTAPTSVSPLAMVGPDVYATYDPEADEAVALEAAYRTARILALLTLRDAPVQLDSEAVTRSLEDLTRQVECVRSLKTKLTHIGWNAPEVSDALDLLRVGVLRSVKDLEAHRSRREGYDEANIFAFAFRGTFQLMIRFARCRCARASRRQRMNGRDGATARSLRRR